MPEYTQEQIEESKSEAREIITKNPSFLRERGTMNLVQMLDILISAIEAAEKERDDAQMREVESNELFWRWKKHAETLAVYAAKLEKAGDWMRVGLAFNYKPCVDWDAARKEKP